MAKKSKPGAQRKGGPLKAKSKPVKIRKPWDETGTTWREGSRYPQPNSSAMSEWGRGRPASRTASILRRHPPREARGVRVKRSERLRHGITSCAPHAEKCAEIAGEEASAPRSRCTLTLGIACWEPWPHRETTTHKCLKRDELRQCSLVAMHRRHGWHTVPVGGEKDVGDNVWERGHGFPTTLLQHTCGP